MWVHLLLLLPPATLSYGPHLTAPLPPTLTFSNSSGGVVGCGVGGEPPPQVEWVTGEGGVVGSRPPLLTVHPNGSLHYSPFPAEAWRADTHDLHLRYISSWRGLQHSWYRPWYQATHQVVY